MFSSRSVCRLVLLVSRILLVLLLGIYIKVLKITTCLKSVMADSLIAVACIDARMMKDFNVLAIRFGWQMCDQPARTCVVLSCAEEAIPLDTHSLSLTPRAQSAFGAENICRPNNAELAPRAGEGELIP